MTTQDHIPLYRQVLGDRFDLLPEPVKAIHDSIETRCWAGTATVVRGTNPLGRCVGWMIGLPKAADAVSVSVTMTCSEDREIWLRDFGGHILESVQLNGTGACAGLIQERIGPFTLGLGVQADETGLSLNAEKMWVFGLSAPRFLLPNGPATEQVKYGRFAFDVTFKAPLVGLIARYTGTLSPA